MRSHRGRHTTHRRQPHGRHRHTPQPHNPLRHANTQWCTHGCDTPQDPPQPADQGPPRDAPRRHRGRPTHSEAPAHAASQWPTMDPPHTRAHSPPPTMEKMHPSHSPPIPTHERCTGATRRRDPPTCRPHKRGSPRVAHTQRSLHHWAHSPVGRHPQAPRDHTPLVATLQSHTPHPRGTQAPHHNDPAPPTY